MPRLEAVLGTSLTDLDWSTLERLVSDRVPEDLSLDYKAVLHAPDEDGRFELAKDVAAFANASGGLIVIGISEAKGIPSGFSQQNPTEADRQRVVSTVVERLAPFVADIEVGLIGAPDGSSGCLLILVPPSAQAPHAVTSTKAAKKTEHALWWPVREASQARWLREAELSTRYRERFRGAIDVVARAHTVLTDGIAGLRRDEQPRLVLALAPSRPAINRAVSPAVRDEVMHGMIRGAGFPHYQFSSQASFGRGRVVLSDRFAGAPLSSDHHVDLYMDGSAFAAVAIPGVPPPEVQNGRIVLPRRGHGVASERVARWLITLLDRCARHAVLFGAGGDFEVMAQLLVPLERDELSFEAPELPVDERQSEMLVLTEMYGYHGGVRMVPGSAALTATTPVSVTTAASVALSPRDLVSACARLSSEIFAEFGQLPSDAVLDLSGAVHEQAVLGQGLDDVHSWANAHGLLV